MIREVPGCVRWGSEGRAYHYPPGDQAARRLAIRRAHADAERRARRWLPDASTSARRADARGDIGAADVEPLVKLYNGMLAERVALTSRLIARLVVPALAPRLDAAGDEPPASSAALAALRVIAAIRVVVDGLGLGDAPGLAFLGAEIEEKATQAADRTLSRLLSVPIASSAPTGDVSRWAAENARLITSIPDQLLGDVAALVEGAVRDGTPIRDLRATIANRYAVADSRASLIARDQTAKLVSRVQQSRHEKYGITEYVWSTSGDARVRQEHARLDGKVFRYAFPPVADASGRRGHPGELWQCRCRARPVRPSDDGAAIRAAAIARQEREAVELSSAPTVQGQIANRSGFSDWNAARIRELKAGGQRARRAVGL